MHFQIAVYYHTTTELPTTILRSLCSSISDDFYINLLPLWRALDYGFGYFSNPEIYLGSLVLSSFCNFESVCDFNLTNLLSFPRDVRAATTVRKPLLPWTCRWTRCSRSHHTSTFSRYTGLRQRWHLRATETSARIRPSAAPSPWLRCLWDSSSTATACPPSLLRWQTLMPQG